MLNNKAQTLVIFIILLPLFILFLAYVFDFLNVNYEKQKLNDIASLIEINDENTNYCKIIYANDKDANCTVESGKVIITKRIKSIFGFITDRKYFDIRIEVKL